jgi:hypothetical protein
MRNATPQGSNSLCPGSTPRADLSSADVGQFCFPASSTQICAAVRQMRAPLSARSFGVSGKRHPVDVQTKTSAPLRARARTNASPAICFRVRRRTVLNNVQTAFRIPTRRPPPSPRQVSFDGENTIVARFGREIRRVKKRRQRRRFSVLDRIGQTASAQFRLPGCAAFRPALASNVGSCYERADLAPLYATSSAGATASRPRGYWVRDAGIPSTWSAVASHVASFGASPPSLWQPQHLPEQRVHALVIDVTGQLRHPRRPLHRHLQRCGRRK